MGLAINWIFGLCLGLLIPITMVNLLVSSSSSFGFASFRKLNFKTKIDQNLLKTEMSFWG
jgi:hypothetical protein